MHFWIWYLGTNAIKIFTSFYFWKLLYAPFAIDNYSIELLKLTNFEYTIINANFCMWHLLCTFANDISSMQYCTFAGSIVIYNFQIHDNYWQKLHTLLQLITFVFDTEMDTSTENFYMHYFSCWLEYLLCTQYHNSQTNILMSWQFLCFLMLLITLLFTIALLHYCTFLTILLNYWN